MTRMAGSKNVTDFLGIKPEYGAMGSQDIADTAREFASVTQGNALAANAGLKAQADIAAAQHYADATAAGAQAQSQASMVGGIAGGLGGLSGFMPKGGLFGGGGGSAGGSINASSGTSNLFGNTIGSFGGGAGGVFG